jgi:hypothetical protein
MTTQVLEMLDRLQKKQAPNAGRARTSPPVNTEARANVNAPQNAPQGLQEADRQSEVLTHLREAIREVSAAYPAGFPEAMLPGERAALQLAQDRLDRALGVGAWGKAEAALAAYKALWLDTINKHGGKQ